MVQFCDELRAERERQGLSLEDISHSTKITERHLQALESGEFHRLPGGVFRKGFFRSYLGALRLNAGVWVPRFEGELRAAGLGEPDAAAAYGELARNIKRAHGTGEREDGSRWSGVLAMLLLLLVFTWCVWHFALRSNVRIAPVRIAEQTSSLGRVAAPRALRGAPANAEDRRSGLVLRRPMLRFARPKRAA